MLDYEPLDIAQHLNGGLDALGAGAAAEIGPRHFRGLPFSIGDDRSRCFIALDGDSEPVSIPVGNSASRIIFAQRAPRVRNRRRRTCGQPRRRLRILAGERTAARRPNQGAIRDRLCPDRLLPGRVRAAVPRGHRRQAPTFAAQRRRVAGGRTSADRIPAGHRPQLLPLVLDQPGTGRTRWSPSRSFPERAGVRNRRGDAGPLGRTPLRPDRDAGRPGSRSPTPYSPPVPSISKWRWTGATPPMPSHCPKTPTTASCPAITAGSVN